MDYKELLTRYQALLAENKKLKAQLGIFDETIAGSTQGKATSSNPITNQTYDNQEKIQLFMSLFKGRDDVFAKRWQSKDRRSGYTPVCLNEWQTGVCDKPRIKCSECDHKSYAVLDENVI